MTKRDIAGFLGVDVQTLRNWQKTRPNLYRVIMQGLAIEEAVKESKEHYEKLSSIAKDAQKYVLKK
ncbi:MULTISPECIES: hypothetical protein [Campylobacter]|uniref:Transcriptional regulator n=1 Tax=Campylobacter armoricus TaxID=2505970 RepID=A0A7L5IN40_9BACT|nr:MULTISPECIES: hypothetical protein [Campylobacter]AJC85778.1 hypothetical protein CAQ16704_0267 [Campylobacter sp. RM16704]QKF79189.1 hypothetical protein CARM_0232 [Campylobacter armoricus]